MRNTLGDLNNHLFAQLERLSDEDIKGEELREEVNRSKAIMGIAKNIIDNGSLVLESQKFIDDRFNENERLPKMLDGGNNV
ncbi:hypothetical protein MXF31_09250 [Mammaliicoccus sciuri]|uniref:hypothetical protein n=1 Tax=Mammaliicoccus sciuri TaxID=1296 RepID=UPI002DB7214F|nr:hypothetical protein [Mammaliicoccus sciuri]MEB5649838.1 hypothetical protein [Mammaliicoccus sciuri]